MINDGEDCNGTTWGVQWEAKVRDVGIVIGDRDSRSCEVDCTAASHNAQRVVLTRKLVSRGEGNIIIRSIPRPK